jgi:hypothetical protein
MPANLQANRLKKSGVRFQQNRGILRLFSGFSGEITGSTV